MATTGKDKFEKNLHAIFAHDPALGKRILEFTAKDHTYDMTKDKYGNPVIMVPGEDGGLISLESVIDPRAEAVAYLENKEKVLVNPRIVFFLGMGTGYLLEAFLNKRPALNHAIYVIEKDPGILCTNMFLSDMTPVLNNPNIRFIVGISEEEIYPHFYELLNRWVPYVRAITFLEQPVEYNLSREYYQKCTKLVRDAAREVLQRYGNSPEDSLRGIVNMLDNVKNILQYPGVDQVKDVFAGRPAIIVAAGPSLEMNVHLLREVGDRAVIIACDAMLKGLLKRGITPHAIVSVERIPDLYHLFEDIPEAEVEDVWFCACPVVYANNFDVYPGPKVIAYRNFSHFKWLRVDKGILDSGPSVIFLGTKLAEKMGCNPIILIGQDLAYGREKDTHTTMTTYVSEEARHVLSTKNMGAFEVPANGGGTVLTNLIWYSMIKHYEIDIAGYHGAYINATEGGALLAGATVMTLREAIDEYLTESLGVKERMREALRYPSLDRRIKDAGTVLDQVRVTQQFISRTIEQCKRGMRIAEKLDDKLRRAVKRKGEGNTAPVKDVISIDEVNRILNKMIKIKEDMINGDPLFYLFLMHYIQAFLFQTDIECVSAPEKFEAGVDRSYFVIQVQRKFFHVMIGLIQIIREGLDRSGRELDKWLETLRFLSPDAKQADRSR